MTEEIKLPQTNNCLYVECTPLVDIQQDQNGFIQTAQINYNIQPQNHMPLGSYSIQTVAPVQVYSGAYTMPVQQMQPTVNVLHNQVIASSIPIQQTQLQLQPQPPALPQPEPQEKEKPKTKSKAEVKDEPPKRCATCNKTFATTAKLSRHMKTHSTDMPYKCGVCSKAFSHSGNYKIHLRMHTDERPFKCTVCGKGCRQAQDLEKHMRTHTGRRSFREFVRK